MSQRRVRKHVNPLSIIHEVHFDGFSDDNPIWMDIGSCKGEFVEKLAKKFPGTNFIACEIRKPLAEKLRQKFADFSNVAVFDGDAGRNFENLLKSSFERGVKLEKVFVNFPDPWFKDRHKKRRFINPDFLKKSADFLDPSVEFIFQTDQEFLFNETLEVLAESPFTRIERFEGSPFGVPTDWESAKLAAGDEIYRMKFYKG